MVVNPSKVVPMKGKQPKKGRKQPTGIGGFRQHVSTPDEMPKNEKVTVGHGKKPKSARSS
jgi:hypothetical protein